MDKCRLEAFSDGVIAIKPSPALYLGGIALARWRTWSAQLSYVLAALLRLVPDRRNEGTLHGPADSSG